MKPGTFEACRIFLSFVKDESFIFIFGALISIIRLFNAMELGGQLLIICDFVDMFFSKIFLLHEVICSVFDQDVNYLFYAKFIAMFLKNVFTHSMNCHILLLINSVFIHTSWWRCIHGRQYLQVIFKYLSLVESCAISHDMVVAV